jgi:hypothetical protein
MNLKEAISQPFVKVYNFIQREFAYSSQIDTQAKHIPYGITDSFPQQLSTLVKGSPTATSCLSTVADFIAGEGFNLGKDLENLIINPNGLKFHRFHNIQSEVFAENWGVATLVKFNKVGDITELHDIPFGYCRLGKPDDNGVISKIHYNPYLPKFTTSIIQMQHPFNLPEILNGKDRFIGWLYAGMDTHFILSLIITARKNG